MRSGSGGIGHGSGGDVWDWGAAADGGAVLAVVGEAVVAEGLRDRGFERWRRGRLPRLDGEAVLMLMAVWLAGGRALSEVHFRRAGGGRWYLDWGKGHGRRILRRLIRERLIEVVGLSPARYRLTRLGRIVRELRR